MTSQQLAVDRFPSLLFLSAIGDVVMFVTNSASTEKMDDVLRFQCYASDM